ncbi:putative major fimbrial subunit LpfA [Klebsiella spallanzanii]|uniref:Major fimbrial subunit LpfA n=1 Tax=Klebsiella spallanzanii TaxID=2587528 RepID=A0A564JFA7_9ENTR|nr:fimbrial protein [Klebsiella spallanzanii]MDM4207240.1 fimbrial protein [Klebsiella spallanzanii]VUS40069.1 putative major fimbrial subunit LpfA [Klebsiella spallanzanii]VUS55595.1 putative major fimbrial subunit LpfA [Klebsiella spallanzanii]
MKKTLLAAVVAGCATFSGAALADDGQVKFIGDIIDAGCDVVNDLSNPLEVQMGQIAKTAFSGTGSTAAEQGFDIKLENCPTTVTKASVLFSGDNVGGDNDKLQLTGAGTDPDVAEGVALQLVDGSTNSTLPLFTRSTSLTIPSTGNIDLPFRVRYIQTDATVVAGKANGTANFTISYN